MKKIILAVFLAFLISGCISIAEAPNEDSIKLEHYSDGILKSAYSFKNGKRDGICRDYSPAGILQSATEYKENVIDGRRSIFYPEGSLWTQEYYKNGKLAHRVEYNEEGYVIAENDFK